MKHWTAILSEKYLNPELSNNIKNGRQTLFTLYYYLQSFLFLAVTCIASGVGVLLYQNIASIGHLVLVLLTWLSCLGCFWFCFKKRLPFNYKVAITHPLFYFDYILLLGALLLTTAFAYTQYQFSWLGSDWSATTLIPCVLLFIAAYFFDQTTLLSMAIVLFGSWLGLQVAPYQLLFEMQFNELHMVLTAIIMALLLIGAFFLTYSFQIKQHFEFTYINFAMHIIFIALLNGLFFIEPAWIWWFAGTLFTTTTIWYAFYRSSFYILLCGFAYGYIIVSYAMVRFCTSVLNDSLGIYLLLIYFIASGIMLISYLRMFKRTIQGHVAIR